MSAIAHRFRTRLVPALLTAFGVALLATGLLSYTTAVEPGPVALPLASYQPLPTISVVRLPNGSIKPDPSFPADRVATRVVIPKLQIDLPVMLQTANYGEFPLCDVALYQPLLGQPGQGRATYIYAHARDGMFLPLLIASLVNNGQRMIGYVVEVYTSAQLRLSVHDRRGPSAREGPERCLRRDDRAPLAPDLGGPLQQRPEAADRGELPVGLKDGPGERPSGTPPAHLRLRRPRSSRSGGGSRRRRPRWRR